MKQFLLSLCISCSLLGTISAQIITIDPPLVVANFDGVLLNGNQDLVPEHVAFTNNTTDTIRLKWQREIPEACPEGWKTQVCDNSYCFASSTSTNYNPPQIEVPFTLAPGETFPDFIFHVLPATTPGCCLININFSEIDNLDEIIGTLTYDVRVNDPECSLSSTNEPALVDGLRAFPNPTTGAFSITDNPLVKTITVHDLQGKQVARFQHSNGNTYDISGNVDGLYLVNMQDENGETIKTVRMTKQGIRP